MVFYIAQIVPSFVVLNGINKRRNVLALIQFLFNLPKQNCQKVNKHPKSDGNFDIQCQIEHFEYYFIYFLPHVNRFDIRIQPIEERSIFQTFRKTDFWARFLLIELNTSNFGYLLIFFILLNCAKFEEDRTTFILHILQGSPFEFWVNYKNKKHQREEPCKMCKINVVQSSSNLAQSSKMKKKASSKSIQLNKPERVVVL